MHLTRDDGLVLSDDPARVDIPRVIEFLSQAYWAKDRTPEMIERSFANSRPYGVYTPDGQQVAVARATTDLVSFCWIGDVYVDTSWRGQRIGHWLVGELVADLRRQGLRRFTLATRDAHSVYADLGFRPLADPSKWMELDERAIIP